MCIRDRSEAITLSTSYAVMSILIIFYSITRSTASQKASSLQHHLWELLPKHHPTEPLRTVSYTHLDVYKRQVTTGAYRAVDFIKKNMNLDKKEADIEDSKTVVKICTESVCLLYTSRCV